MHDKNSSAAEKRWQPPKVLPDDVFNRELLSNVFPPDWENPEPASCYNLVVVGGGTAGLVTAAGGAGLGAKVALVEQTLLGGDCLNVGCVPSKTLLRTAKAVGEIRRAPELGVDLAETALDFPKVMSRMRRLRAAISRHDSARRFHDLGVDVFLGSAKFTGPDRVEVGSRTLRFRKAVIATGARPSAPPIPGLKEAGFLTNETVFSLTELPKRIALIGAGPIGCELAQAFQRFGSRVQLLEVLPRILAREDPDAAQIIADVLARDGVEILLGSRIREVIVRNGTKVLFVEQDGRERELEVDEIIVGAGRKPNVEQLGLEEAGVDYDPRKGVQVNDRLQTTNPRIYAAGDVCTQFQFTHMADAMARIVLQNALFWGRRKVSTLTVPWATFTDPEIAHVGLYEQDASSKGVEVDTYVRHFSDVDRAVADGEAFGFVKVHVKKGTDRILGATIVARHAGDLISEITVAMAGGIGLARIANVIHPYPTQAEAIKQVGDAYNRTRLTPFLKSLFSRFLSLVR